MTGITTWRFLHGPDPQNPTVIPLDLTGPVTIGGSSPEPAPGTITVEKAVSPDAAQGFEFTGDLGGGGFFLDSDGDETDNPPMELPSSRTFSELAAGDYDVTEQVPAGWELTGIDCGAATTTAISDGDGVRITLNAGGAVRCTFTNDASCAAEATFRLFGGFTAVVFTGADDTPIEEVANAVGPALDAIFLFDQENQDWLAHRPIVPIPELNTLLMVQPRDVLFIRLPQDASVTLTLPDLLIAGPVAVELPAGFTFVGFTGADGTGLADLLDSLPAGVRAGFRFDASAQAYDTFHRGRQPFLSSFGAADRLDGLFVLNDTGSAVTLPWQQEGADC